MFFLGLVWFFGLGLLLGLPKRYYIGGSRWAQATSILLQGYIRIYLDICVVEGLVLFCSEG